MQKKINYIEYDSEELADLIPLSATGAGQWEVSQQKLWLRRWLGFLVFLHKLLLGLMTVLRK